MAAGVLVLPEVMVGMTEASMTRRLSLTTANGSLRSPQPASLAI
jgi:hypothetical protein